ncbi:hypothetical protein TBLA_0E04470 [Henningerozyma blattae CBS 6284]|uniref:Large ribosomal subunit protein bL34m n=1 Tax=Henningerozyma blattae (strain ATCC 34711 / CBS 6284 / DSM 70876 / NBRC 10599 / NRRL Y-10934 / UCD 77-7) TaxID=1071380 RepID=I2H548_HENB6|nr:hypothetical protein TBLA_0E04470 [Tetrapisispora blattae CBS 6284]CCH61500.1 hypothetical protein TBLA_0E04470 [Tetrapisispora blattae CBS 6284]
MGIFNSLTRIACFSKSTALNSMSLLNKSLLINNNIIGNNKLMIDSRRWKSRGNTYQPSTLKRKRKHGFLSRAKSYTMNKILKRRKAKGRWFLSH